MIPELTASQWLVLDNLRMGWKWNTNLIAEYADPAYRFCVGREYIHDGKITPAGEMALLANNPRRQTVK